MARQFTGKIFLFLWIILFVASTGASEVSQETNIPEVDIEGGEDFKPDSDELGEVERIELEVRHDDQNPPWGSNIQIEGDGFTVTEEEAINSEEGIIEAETGSPSPIFEEEINIYAETNEEILLDSIILYGERRFKDLRPAETADTGEVNDTLDPELEVSVNHPENEDLFFTFYDVDSESELGETFSFTTCGQEGRIGPSQVNCDSEYEDTSLEEDVDILGNGIQEWEVPYEGTYEITAVGALGGGPYGGYGKVVSAEMFLEEGDRLRIVSGQVGDLFEDTFTAGSGGSYVTRVVDNGYEMFDGEDIEPLVVAGGGAGGTWRTSDTEQDARPGTCGGDAVMDPDGSGPTGDGGCAGDGGEMGNRVYGGGGLLGDGEDNDNNGGGQAFVNGALGGTDDSDGGFGGGGGSQVVSWDRAGGGGGFSGGGAGRGGNNDPVAGGGGGTYVTTEADNVEIEASSEGQGYVELEIDGNPEEVIGVDSVESGEVASAEWSDRENHESYNWTVEVCESGTGECILSSSIWEFTVNVDVPEVELDFIDYQSEETGYEHAFNATAEIEFSRNDYEPICKFEFEDQENNNYEIEVEVNESWGDSDEALCEKKVFDDTHDDYDPVEDLYEGFDVLEEIDVKVNVTDEEIGSTIVEDSNEIPNFVPEPSFIDPSDDGFVADDEVQLEVDAFDRDDSQIYAYFFEGHNQDPSNLLHEEDLSVPDDSIDIASFTWPNLEIGQEYEWTLVLDDTHENFTAEYVFSRIASANYRPEYELNLEYSSIVMTESVSRDLIFTVENNVDIDRELVTYLEGVNAEFLNYQGSKHSYNLPEYESKQFQARISPESTDPSELKIITEDVEAGVNTTESVPVDVRDLSRTGAREVSGVGSFQIAAVVLISVIWYSLLL